MVTLETVNLVLDVVLKLILLAVLVFIGYLVFKLDKIAKRFERTVKNVERSSETIDDAVAILRRIPFVGPKGGKRNE